MFWLPIERPGNTTAPRPTRQSSPTRTLPPRWTPGATCVCSPITQSWSIEVAVFTMTLSPMTAPALITPRAQTNTPRPSCACGDTTAEGWTTFTGRPPRAHISPKIWRRTALSPIATMNRKRAKEKESATGTP